MPKERAFRTNHFPIHMGKYLLFGQRPSVVQDIKRVQLLRPSLRVEEFSGNYVWAGRM